MAEPQTQAVAKAKPRGGWAKASVRTLAWSLGLIVVGVWALFRTALGHQVILNWAVAQADQRVAGRIEVDRIRSGGILRGALLSGVRLRTPDGELFASADSLEVSYSGRGLLAGDVVLRDLRVWGAEVELAWERGRQGSTLGRWLHDSSVEAASEPEVSVAPTLGAEPRQGTETVAEEGETVRLEGIRFEDSAFRLRVPSDLDPDGAVRLIPAEDGRVLALDLDIAKGEIGTLSVGPEVTILEVDDLQARLNLLREVLEIQELTTRIRVGSGRLDAEIASMTLPQFRSNGDVRVYLGAEPARRVEVDVALRDVQGSSLGWIAPWAPPFTGAGLLDGYVARGESRWYISELDADWDGGRVVGDGTVRLEGETLLDDLALEVEGLPVSALAHYVEFAQGKPGLLSGNLRLNGPVAQLGLVGRVGLRDSLAGLSVADLNGVVTPAPEGLGFSEMEIYASSLGYASVQPWAPALPVAGRGSARVVLNGSPAAGLRLDLDLRRDGGEGEESRVLALASVRRDSAGWRVDVQGDAAPFQLTALHDRYPGLPVRGAVTGSFRVSGPLDSLALRSELRQEGGRLSLDGALDPGALEEWVEFDAEAEGFDLGAYYVPAGDRTRVSGEASIAVRGRGAALEGDARVRLRSSTLLGLEVDSILVRSQAADGRLVLDTARASVAGVEFDGGGTLALPGAAGREGTVRLDFVSDSIGRIRSAFLGRVVHARDTLSALDAEVLILEGINPDTLPLQADITLQGSAEGTLSLQGAVDDFSGSGRLSLRDAGYGDSYVRRALLDFRGRDLPGDESWVQLALDTDSLRYLNRELAASELRTVFTRGEARTAMTLVRGPRERYTLAGGVSRGATGGVRVDLDQADLVFDSVTFALVAPTRLSWNENRLRIDDLEMRELGESPVRIRANGVVPRSGEADFVARAEGVALERVKRLLQIEEAEWTGTVDLDVRVQGTGERPVIDAALASRGLEVGSFAADSTRITVSYEDRSALVELGAWRNELQILQGGGTVPVDLALYQRGTRIPDETMDVRANLVGVEVAPFLALLEDLEEVEGTLSGEFTVGGTLAEPIPQGLLRLEGGAWTVGALGVRQSDVAGTFELTPNRAVAVNARATSGGRLDLSGEVLLEPLADPELDLALRFQDFQGVDRRDVTGALSGTLSVTGRYNKPEIRGALTVDEGVLFLEEVQRAVGVVDLTDPLFLGLVDNQDIAITVDRPLLAGIRNPFLDSLRMDVDLNVPRETWLRSQDLDVEISGQLQVAYDRPNRDLVLVGELLARRGQYTIMGLGKTFEVQGGSVSFIGTPGINPLLDIQAVAPIRRQEGGTLEIQATVEGSLVDPRVTLSTEEAGLAQSDLFSYLIFGRPSTDITGSATGSSTNQFASNLSTGAVSAGLGTLVSQLSMAAQRTDFLDYVSVSQLGDLGVNGGGAFDSFSNTQLELGWYLGSGDLFGVLVFRPAARAGGGGSSPIDGARIEWQSSDQYHWELFAVKRFLQQGIFSRDLTEDEGWAFGLAFFREWGY